MIELYVYSTTMSPENQGVFQLVKELHVPLGTGLEDFLHPALQQNSPNER